MKLAVSLSAYDSASSRTHPPHCGAALKSNSSRLWLAFVSASAASTSFFHSTAIFESSLACHDLFPGPQTFSALKASGRPCLGVLEFSVVIPKQILKTQFGSGTSKVRLHSYDHSPLKSGFKGWTDLSILRSLKRSALVPLSSSGFSLIPSSSLTSSAAAMSTNSVPS